MKKKGKEPHKKIKEHWLNVLKYQFLLRKRGLFWEISLNGNKIMKTLHYFQVNQLKSY